MDSKVLKLRANQIAKIQRDKEEGIVPDWRKYKVEELEEYTITVTPSASTSAQANGATVMDT